MPCTGYIVNKMQTKKKVAVESKRIVVIYKAKRLKIVLISNKSKFEKHWEEQISNGQVVQ